MKYLKKGMSVIKLEKLKKSNTPRKLKEKINKQIEITKESNKKFVDNLLKSKWFKLGITQTIKKRQATRILTAKGNVLYKLDPCDVMLNLINLTFKINKTTSKGFTKYLSENN